MKLTLQAVQMIIYLIEQQMLFNEVVESLELVTGKDTG